MPDASCLRQIVLDASARTWLVLWPGLASGWKCEGIGGAHTRTSPTPGDCA